MSDRASIDMGTYAKETPDDTISRWLLLEASRVRLLGGAFLCIAGTVAVLVWAGILTGASTSPMSFLLSGFLGGNLTLITVVISINQLVLSRELGAPGELHQRLQEALSYRESVDDVVEAAPPVTPRRFLQVLHHSLDDLAADLADEADGEHPPELQSRLDALVESVRADADDVNSALDSSENGIYAVITATLRTNHAGQLYEIDRLSSAADESLDKTIRDHLGRLRDVMIYIDVARKYFRTVYIQKELAFLSRIILYVGIPGQLVLVGALLGYHAVATGTIPPIVMAYALPITIAAAVAPLLVLGAYVPRLAWVAQRNASVAPFAASDEEFEF
ncbi:hypothetical protein [Halomarina litorea]|uniref:hypothetical protein n=1 Tax=Halomarina litorea TaxID=2961595 RepID=UPI0020C425EB|nr:hypothetical protein [Halomarina sp. BCD28]